MTRSKKMEDEYYRWLVSRIGNHFDYGVEEYSYLLHHIHQIDFYYTIDMDRNRFQDGIDLRYTFGEEMHYPQKQIKLYLDCRPCSVLEMMVALAIRVENHIMEDPDMGDRTSVWFWKMINNLGLANEIDSLYDEKRVDSVISKLLQHRYRKNGVGGLFRTYDNQDMRKMEIWYQMCAYFNTLL